jgi:uncharacterized protein YdaU (DUF1376 family)
MSDDHIPFIAYYFRDWKSDTEFLSPAESGAYINAVNEYLCQSCQGLPDDDLLRRMCRVEVEDWTEIKAAVFNGRFFRLEDGLWHQKRAREEYVLAGQRRDMFRERASKGGLAKAAKYQQSKLPPARRAT